MNSNIGLLSEIWPLVQLVRDADLRKSVWREDDDFVTLLLWDDRCLVEVGELKVDNYVHIAYVNFVEERKLSGGVLLDIAVAVGDVQVPNLYREAQENGEATERLFISHAKEKRLSYGCEVLALRALFPKLRAKGLRSLENGTFDERLNERITPSRLSPSAAERYRRLLNTG